MLDGHAQAPQCLFHRPEGACSVLFTTQGFFKALASTVKDPSKEEAILTEHTADPVYAVNIDMSANQLTYLLTSWGFISK